MAIAKRSSILILCFALASFAVALPRPRPVAGPDIFRNKNASKDMLLPGEKIVNVMSFGAKPDGVTDSTSAFMQAWQAVCKSPEQSRLYVPGGRFLVSSMFFQGPCLSPNPVTIQVEGTVLASTDISEYENGDWLMFQKLNGLKLIGGGTFDGQGQSSWEFAENCESGNDNACVRNPSGSENVFINRLKCGPGHGISIGSLGKVAEEREVRGVRIKNSQLIGTTNGLRIKSWPDRYPGGASEISFSNITMENVKNPIIIDQEYECDPDCKKKPSLVKIRDIHFSNIKGTTISPIAVDLRCSQLYPCQGITLRDIDLKLGLAPATARCSNIKPIYGGIINPPACL
ncbi:Pectin lyase fold/virulence factor [Sesbania bispinosa]|nr:Pectin lyase fold/virulence factor [Sesbania bispinosa]